MSNLMTVVRQAIRIPSALKGRALTALHHRPHPDVLPLTHLDAESVAGWMAVFAACLDLAEKAEGEDREMEFDTLRALFQSVGQLVGETSEKAAARKAYWTAVYTDEAERGEAAWESFEEGLR